MSYTRELSITETQVLWKYIYRTGSNDKRKVIEYLYSKGRLSKKQYSSNCPLCEALLQVKERNWTSCQDCPWTSIDGIKCMDEGSPFRSWFFSVWVGKDMKAQNKLIYKHVKKMT